MPKFARFLLICTVMVLPFFRPPPARARTLDYLVNIFRSSAWRVESHSQNIAPLFVNNLTADQTQNNTGESDHDRSAFQSVRPMNETIPTVPEFGLVTGIITFITSTGSYLIWKKKSVS